MSYNNFSYFNAPTIASQWLGTKEGEARQSIIDINNRNSKNYGQSGTLVNAEPVQSRNEVIKGTVTQLFSTFGYINDNVVFSKADVIGPMVKVGDKVAVDASFQSTNPTKYKGERVYKIEDAPFPTTTTAILKPNVPKKNELTEVISRLVNPTKTRWDKVTESHVATTRPLTSAKDRLANIIKVDSPTTTRSSAPTISKKTSIVIKETKHIKKKFKGGRLISREVLKRKATSPVKVSVTPKTDEFVKHKSESKSNGTPKPYENFAHRELDCAAVRNQWRSISLPKEFFHISLKYQQSFPLNHPMKLGNQCHFKIMDKKVKCIDKHIDAQLRKQVDPKDADSTFVAKVMLLSTDDLAKFYKDTLTLAEEFGGENKIPITKAIKFLVGSTGLDKEFGIGGSWSPSLDGADPETNPRVLINTAIRTCKAMTGVDLSNCSSWPKFLELHYYRPLQKMKSDNGVHEVIDVDAPSELAEYREPRMETVVYYVPDIWNCMPSEDSWKETRRLYQEQLTCIMCPPPVSMRPVSMTNSSIATTPSATMMGEPRTSDVNMEYQEDEEDWDCNDNEDEGIIQDTSTNSDNSTIEEQPTHFSKLGIAGMKIIDIKKELELRKLNTKGVMDQLKTRLKTALDKEEVEEKNKEEAAAVMAPAAVVKLTPSTVISDDQKTELKKLYILPDRPQIIIHQNRKIFAGQMKIRTMSLHSLLSYYDTKLEETTYELAMFAKQFMEMLRRDAVFNIYKSLVVAQDDDLRTVEGSAKKAKLMVTTSKRTVNRPLLFSCTLLDREKTNKMSVSDLKTLIEGLGICLSSDQLSAILDRVKDSGKYLNYRQLTDKEMTDSDIVNLLNMDGSEDLDYIKELAMGNKALFDIEQISIVSSIDLEEIERLKNELDKSERYRQAIELKVDEIKDETERHTSLVHAQDKEMRKLKEQLIDYKTRYRSTRDHSSRYKGDYERLLGQVNDISKLTRALNQCTADTVTEKIVVNERSLSADSKTKSKTTIDKKESKEKDKRVVDVVDIIDIAEETSKDTDEHNALNNTKPNDNILEDIESPQHTS